MNNSFEQAMEPYASLWVIILLLFNRICFAANVSPIELSALYDLYNATNGENWLWVNTSIVGPIWDFDDPDPNPCDPMWQGLTCSCDDVSCTITELLLDSYGMEGTIPDSIGNLTSMRFMTMGINFIAGSVPPSISKLDQLLYLDLGENGNLNGPLPIDIGKLTNLEFLYLSYNSFSGTLPPSISDLKSLRVCQLTDNNFEGSLPETLGNLDALVLFDTSFNLFTGQLPSSIGNMTSLTTFLMNDNNFHGTLPPELCKLTGLVNLYGIDNYFVGSIPECIGEMISLKLFSFNVNQMNGTVPASILRLNQTLEELTMSFNELTGTLPVGLFNTTGSVLDTVYFGHNSLTGPLPDILLPDLLNLDLSYNYFSGTLSDSIVLSSDVVYLDISYNDVVGTLPPAINQNLFLFQLELGHNHFSGPLPESLQGHEYMAQYMLDFNLFTGTVPYSLCYNNPGYIDLESNLLEGTIPDCSTAEGYECGRLVYFSMSENFLSGSIPSYLVKEWNVVTISINNNALTGTLPYFNCTKVLDFLYVQSNQLSGPIQLSAEYRQLQFVDISNNQFTGSLPKDFFNAAMRVKSFAATSNCITGRIPEELCSLTNLTFVDLDGLGTAKVCRSRIFPHLPQFTSFVLDKQIHGGIPSCLFGMPLLQTLHLSGNSIEWSFPSSGLELGPVLSELSLSHNKLSGTIPVVIQSRQWSTLDLSFNKLGGTLDSFIQPSHNNASLILQVNRLSGVIPGSLQDMLSINVLTGNLFDCDFQRNGLPRHDQGHDTYQCGSNSFNQASIGWLVFVVLSLMLLGVISLHKCVRHTAVVEMCSKVWDTVHLYLSQFYEVECELSTFRSSLEYLRNAILILTLGILVVFLPVYSVLTEYYKTAQYQYAWTVSAAFLAGVSPAIILLVLYTVLVVVLFALWFNHVRHKTNLELQGNDNYSVESEKQQKKTSAKVPQGHRVILVTVVIINCVVMVLVNAGYVLIILNDNSQAIFFAQVGVALFKLFWNDFAVRGMVLLGKHAYDVLVMGSTGTSAGAALTDQNSSKQFRVDMPYLTFIVLFNSILAPCLATAAVDSNCFYNIIVAPTAVSLQFPYFNVIGTCNFFVAEYTGETICDSLSEETFVEVTYDPPFIYSYQCTSSILINYAAVYVFMFIFVAFFKPIALYLLHRTYARIPVGSCLHRCIDAIMYELLKPANVKDLKSNQEGGESTASGVGRKVLFFKDRFVLRMVGKIAVFVTFGVIFPPLAVIVCTAFISEIYVTLIIIGRFLAEVKDETARGQFRELLCKDCKGTMKLLLNPMVRLVVPFATIFYGFFVFDIYGDKAGFAQAIWSPIFLALVPGVLWTGYSVYRVLRNRQAAEGDMERQSELVTMNALQIGNVPPMELSKSV